MDEAFRGETRVSTGTEGPETGDITRDHENFELSFFTVTDELMTLTSPMTNNLFPPGKDGKHAILCYTKECSDCESEKNSVSCAIFGFLVDSPNAPGCGASYSLASTEITCCEGHES